MIKYTYNFSPLQYVLVDQDICDLLYAHQCLPTCVCKKKKKIPTPASVIYEIAVREIPNRQLRTARLPEPRYILSPWQTPIFVMTWKREVDGTGSSSFPMRGFGISGTHLRVP
jgi:hypothetical protein